MITVPGQILPGAERVQLPCLGPDENRQSAGSCEESAVEGATLLCLGAHERGELRHGGAGKEKHFPPYHHRALHKRKLRASVPLLAAFSVSAAKHSVRTAEMRSKVQIRYENCGLKCMQGFPVCCWKNKS